MSARLRGHAEARIDEKGRLKIPSAFRKSLGGSNGGALFITALTDDCLQVYPLDIWEEIESKVRELGSMHPLRRKFLTRANRFGTEVEMDPQGRVPLKSTQRDLARINADVVVIGCADHLELWPGEELAAREGKDAFTQEDFMTLGI